MAIEEPAFELLAQDGAFELREYAAVPGRRDPRRGRASRDAGNVAFQRLFRYISGNNVSAAEDRDDRAGDPGRSGEKISMTAPVSQTAAGTGFVVAFTLPSKYTLDTAPKPLDPTVRDPQRARAAAGELALLRALDREQLR